MDNFNLLIVKIVGILLFLLVCMFYFVGIFMVKKVELILFSFRWEKIVLRCYKNWKFYYKKDKVFKMILKYVLFIC